MTDLLQWRALRRRLSAHPGYTGISLATLAVGLGAVMIIFTVVNAVLLRPLPVPESDRLVVLKHVTPGEGARRDLPISDALYLFYADECRSLEGVAGFYEGHASFTDPHDPQRVRAANVTASFFGVLRVPPRLGRSFTALDEREDAAPVIILSDGLWRTRFGADPAVVGRVVDVDGASAEIVGVMPPGFAFPRPGADVWRPLRVTERPGSLGTFRFHGVGRLADGVTLARAQAEASTLLSDIAAVFPGEYAAAHLANVGLRPLLEPARAFVVGDVRPTLWSLLGAVGFLLLIACANVANLHLARFETRRGEVAMRAALGESRARLVVSVLLEHLVIGVLGGVAALALTWLAVRPLAAVAWLDLPRMDEVAIDGRVLIVGFVVSVAASLLCGVLTAARAVDAAARSGSPAAVRTATGGRSRRRFRRGLVAAQIAGALTLLTGSALAVGSFQKLVGLDVGFDPVNVLTFGLELPERTYATLGERLRFHRRVVDLLGAFPGAVGAAAATAVPLGGAGSTYTSEHELEGSSDPAARPVFRWKRVSPGYFDALRIRFVTGRDFSAADAERHAPVAIVSQATANAYWPGESAVGKGIRPGGLPAQEGDGWFRVVGVVDDVRETELHGDRLPMAYYPMLVANGGAGNVPSAMAYVMRTRNTVAPTVAEQVVRTIDPTLPPSGVVTLETLVVRARGAQTFVMALLLAAAALGFVLALVGLYGVVSGMVAQRRREIAVRLAVGARAADVRRLVLAEVTWMVLAGVVAGIGAIVSLTHRIQALSFDVGPVGPVLVAGVSTALAATCLLAGWGPARRAARIDPAVALGAD